VSALARSPSLGMIYQVRHSLDNSSSSHMRAAGQQAMHADAARSLSSQALSPLVCASGSSGGGGGSAVQLPCPQPSLQEHHRQSLWCRAQSLDTSLLVLGGAGSPTEAGVMMMGGNAVSRGSRAAAAAAAAMAHSESGGGTRSVSLLQYAEAACSQNGSAPTCSGGGVHAGGRGARAAQPDVQPPAAVTAPDSCPAKHA
jgi:hypothetical protein